MADISSRVEKLMREGLNAPQGVIDEITDILNAVDLLSSTEAGYIDAVTAGATAASKAVVLDSGGDATSGPVILSDLPTVAGVGITGAADNFASGVVRVGTLYKTTIVVDIDGLNSGGAIDDIIGKDGADVAHLGQITAARNGTIFAGLLTCIEAPAGGDADINMYSAVEATGVEDTLITALDEVQLCDSGDLTAASRIPLTDYPRANDYLYLATGAATANTYTAGILVIELWGK
jgi:hypothetical protein